MSVIFSPRNSAAPITVTIGYADVTGVTWLARPLRQRVEEEDQGRRSADRGHRRPAAAGAEREGRASEEHEPRGDDQVSNRYPEHELLPRDRPERQLRRHSARAEQHDVRDRRGDPARHQRAPDPVTLHAPSPHG